MPEQQQPEAPQEDEAPQFKVTTGHLEPAQNVIGMEFTPAEREQMQGAFNEFLDSYTYIRNTHLDNGVSPALRFDPSPTPPPPQKIPRTYHMSAREDLERPENLEDLAFYPVTRLAQLIRTKKVSSVELTQMYIDRLKRYDPYLKCVVTLMEDSALAQAKRADDELARSIYRSPLHGIPWGAKDLLATKGVKTTWGAMPYKEQMIDLDATVVQRLEQAGAVLVAKLTLGALAYGDVWFDGKTRSPWDNSLGSSGSSAGPGAAVAGGLVGFAIGTETNGSIVSPSTRCGVTGLRPTFGRVSRYGAMALAWSMDKIGPMARSVEDCALVFSAIYGPDGHDNTIVDLPFTYNPYAKLTDLKVGYIENMFPQPPEDEENPTGVYENNLRVLDVLQDLGAELVPVSLPDFNVSHLLGTILLAEAAAAFDELTRSDQDDLMRRQVKGAWPNLFRAARFIPAVEYINANRIRAQLTAAFNALMNTVDVYVAPSLVSHPLTMTNLTGHPAMVVPNGFLHDGNPSSITFVGGLYREDVVLTAAKAYQDATDHHLKVPTMDYSELPEIDEDNPT